jgi:hypothetical protein
MSEDTQLTIIPEVNPLDDPRPESRAFTNVKLYNHLIAHRNAGPERSFCSIDCMTREFEGRSFESGRQIMRRRLSTFQRWCRPVYSLSEVIPRASVRRGHD